jgi:hypothetical protein
MSSKPERIHGWDKPTLRKAFLFGAVLEAIAIAPAVLSPWGHAGPEGLPAWFSVFVHAPAALLLGFLKVAAGIKGEESLAAFAVEAYLIQTLIISYIAFVWLRWKKRRTGAR